MWAGPTFCWVELQAGTVAPVEDTIWRYVSTASLLALPGGCYPPSCATQDLLDFSAPHFSHQRAMKPHVAEHRVGHLKSLHSSFPDYVPANCFNLKFEDVYLMLWTKVLEVPSASVTREVAWIWVQGKTVAGPRCLKWERIILLLGFTIRTTLNWRFKGTPEA